MLCCFFFFLGLWSLALCSRSCTCSSSTASVTGPLMLPSEQYVLLFLLIEIILIIKTVVLKVFWPQAYMCIYWRAWYNFSWHLTNCLLQNVTSNSYAALCDAFPFKGFRNMVKLLAAMEIHPRKAEPTHGQSGPHCARQMVQYFLQTTFHSKVIEMVLLIQFATQYPLLIFFFFFYKQGCLCAGEFVNVHQTVPGIFKQNHPNWPC